MFRHKIFLWDKGRQRRIARAALTGRDIFPEYAESRHRYVVVNYFSDSRGTYYSSTGGYCVFDRVGYLSLDPDMDEEVTNALNVQKSKEERRRSVTRVGVVREAERQIAVWNAKYRWQLLAEDIEIVERDLGGVDRIPILKGVTAPTLTDRMP